ncbi:unnamed protein product [Musa acuminata subsp. malaccensis]|uniref:(wild Malaysian banana) hypothetical protein n=1 Tax=Musa acuminata subsp. malaccensis TaxID=214687 RepID=A0A804HWC7_MUSAM|nr:unnamed protein product [Musa acuminata subsp. malaccensis]
MERVILCAFSLVFLMMGTTITGSDTGKQEEYRARKLFVFGDSYADTGNLGKKLGRNIARSWFEPYGMTFPKKPAGRFSDGKVLTDYVASLIRISSPIPYKIRRVGDKLMLLQNGMNFAVSGSGIFDTGNFQRNLSAQIDEFQSQIDAGVFSEHDIKFSVALIVASGNDYMHFSQLDPNYLLHLYRFMDRLFAQLKADLKRFDRIGVPKVVVTNLHPIQCIPYYTRQTNYTICPANISAAVADHNRRVDRLVEELDGGSNTTTFLSLDVNTAFSNVLRQVNGAETIKYLLVPCCESSSGTAACSQVDAQGNKLYRVCRHPEEHFYWDSAHPTQAGWAAAFQYLEPSLRSFLLPCPV